MPLRISRITVARLYNLGNYEHIRYELTIEVPEGESARQALTCAETIIEGLEPDKLEFDESNIKNWEENLAKMKGCTDEQLRDDFEWYGTQTREEFIATHESLLAKRKAELEEQRSRYVRCRNMLDDMGGVTQLKDCKVTWD